MPTKATEREVVRVLAERVMGWTRREGNRGAVQIGRLILWPLDDSHIHKEEGWNPLESWADAGMLLEALAKKSGEPVKVEAYHASGCVNYACMLMASEVAAFEVSESGPRAISLAAYEYAMREDR